MIKNRVQGAPAGSAEVSLSAALRGLRADYGGGWVLRGLGPSLARAFVINAVNFAVFERARAALQWAAT